MEAPEKIDSTADNSTNSPTRPKKRGFKSWLVIGCVLFVLLLAVCGAAAGGAYYLSREFEDNNDGGKSPEPAPSPNPEPEPVIAKPLYYYINCSFYKYENGNIEDLTTKLKGYKPNADCFYGSEVVNERLQLSVSDYNAATKKETITNYDINLKALTVKKINTTLSGEIIYSAKAKAYFIYDANESKLYRLPENSNNAKLIYSFKASILGRGGMLTDIVSIRLNASEDKILINDTLPKFDETGTKEANKDITIVDTDGKKIAEVEGTNAVWISDDEIAYHDQPQDSDVKGTNAIRKYDLKAKASSEIYDAKVVPSEIAVDDGYLYINDFRSQDETYRVVRVSLDTFTAELLSERLVLGRVREGKLVGLNLVECNVAAGESSKSYEELIDEGKYPCPADGSEFYSDAIVEIDLSKGDKPQTTLKNFRPTMAW